jgi:hypothetical protein
MSNGAWKTTDYCWLSIINTIKYGDIPIESLTSLACPVNIELQIYKRQLLQNLSPIAKKVIQIIFFEEEMKLTKTNLKLKLRQEIESPQRKLTIKEKDLKISKAFEELKFYARETL